MIFLLLNSKKLGPIVYRLGHAGFHPRKEGFDSPWDRQPNLNIMYKIGIIQKIHDKGLELLDANKDFEYEIIDDVSEENLLKKIHL